MRGDERAQLVGNLAGYRNAVPPEIQMRQLMHFCKADPDYGRRVADGLGLDIEMSPG